MIFCQLIADTQVESKLPYIKVDFKIAFYKKIIILATEVFRFQWLFLCNKVFKGIFCQQSSLTLGDKVVLTSLLVNHWSQV